jgi:hypothetical protein
LTTNLPKKWFWPALTWCLGVMGMVGIWLTIGLVRDDPCVWLAFFAALDIALMMWLSGMQAGIIRVMTNVLGVAIIVLASQWMMAAVMFGGAWGIGHIEAAAVTGKVLTWEYTRLRLTTMDYWYVGLSLWLAAFLGAAGKAPKQ